MPSLAARAAMYARVTGAVVTYLLDIDHPTMDAPIRVCDNREAVLYGGNEYQAYPFLALLPTQHEDKPPRLRFTLDNTDRLFTPLFRNVLDGITVTVRLGLVDTGSDPLEVVSIESGPYEFDRIELATDASQHQLTLANSQILDTAWPRPNIDPTIAPQAIA